MTPPVTTEALVDLVARLRATNPWKKTAIAEDLMREAADALQQVTAERDEARAALTKINGIRNSIIGLHTLNWSEHVYPLVAALEAAGFEGMDYPEARENFGTMLERTNAAEDALATATSELARLRAEGEDTAVVPLEPTDGMQEDGLAALEAAIRTYGKPSLPRFAAAHVYRAMLAARPAAAKEGQADA